MMAVSFTNREKITIKQVEVNMMDKLNCFLEVFMTLRAKTEKT
jgi:hypothetical protein